VVTPSFNQAAFIEEAIRSVLLQGYPNLEYFIMDGGSTDGSVEVIRRYEPWLAGWISGPDEGQSDAINKGWRQGSGDIVAWLNADDMYYPGTFRTIARIFRSRSDVLVVSGAGASCDRDGETVLSRKRPSPMDPYAMISSCGGVPLQPSVFLRREVLDEIGYLDTGLHYVMDWEYWIRIGLRYPAGAVAATDAVLSMNREWPLTKTNTSSEAICNEHRRVMDRLFAHRPEDGRLRAIRGAAYRASYRKQAELELRGLHRYRASMSILKALSIEPFRWNPLPEMIVLSKILRMRTPRG